MSYFLASFTYAKVGEALVWYKGLLADPTSSVVLRAASPERVASVRTSCVTTANPRTWGMELQQSNVDI
jgi:hypothetical protein